MKRLVLALVLVLAAPVSGWGTEVGGRSGSGVAGDNLARALFATASYHGRVQEDKASAFQGHLAPVAFFSFDEDLNDLMNSPIWGAEAGFVYWISRQLGLGLAGQYFSVSGSGTVDGFDLDADFTYFNVYVDIYSRFFGTDTVSMYGLAGMGYSNAHIVGDGGRGLLRAEIDQVDEGPGYHAGLGVSGPWMFGEVRYSESSFGAETTKDGETEITVLNGMQGLIGVRTP